MDLGPLKPRFLIILVHSHKKTDWGIIFSYEGSNFSYDVKFQIHMPSYLIWTKEVILFLIIQYYIMWSKVFIFIFKISSTHNHYCFTVNFIKKWMKIWVTIFFFFCYYIKELRIWKVIINYLFLNYVDFFRLISKIKVSLYSQIRN